MKELIEKSGLKIKEFAEKYKIPYNTVRQWAEGTRKAPEWLKNLFEEYMFKEEFLEILSDKPIIEEKKPITKEENADSIIYEYYTENGLKYRAFMPKEKTEEQIDWFNKLQSKFIHQEEGLNKRIIYKAYLYAEDRR